MQTAAEFELPGQVFLGQQGTGFLGDKATVSVIFESFGLSNKQKDISTSYTFKK